MSSAFIYWYEYIGINKCFNICIHIFEYLRIEYNLRMALVLHEYILLVQFSILICSI